VFWIIVLGIIIIIALIAAASQASGRNETIKAMADVAGSEQTLRSLIMFMARELGASPPGTDRQGELVNEFYSRHRQTADLAKTLTPQNMKTLHPVLTAQADRFDEDLAKAIGGDVAARYAAMSQAERMALGEKFNREMGFKS
jgi:hypothetical protein